MFINPYIQEAMLINPYIQEAMLINPYIQGAMLINPYIQEAMFIGGNRHNHITAQHCSIAVGMEGCRGRGTSLGNM